MWKFITYLTSVAIAVYLIRQQEEKKCSYCSSQPNGYAVYCWSYPNDGHQRCDQLEQTCCS